ncbi:MAG: hypothetical protein WBC63_03180 [Candidatus Bipolaricaulia bacterium]
MSQDFAGIVSSLSRALFDVITGRAIGERDQQLLLMALLGIGATIAAAPATSLRGACCSHAPATCPLVLIDR